jgi:hypothetical protein
VALGLPLEVREHLARAPLVAARERERELGPTVAAVHLLDAKLDSANQAYTSIDNVTHALPSRFDVDSLTSSPLAHRAIVSCAHPVSTCSCARWLGVRIARGESFA